MTWYLWLFTVVGALGSAGAAWGFVRGVARAVEQAVADVLDRILAGSEVMNSLIHRIEKLENSCLPR